MERSRRRLCTLLAAYCTLASSAAISDSIQPQDYRVPAEIAGDACRITDPSDPHQILGPNPAHADCVTAMHPSALPTGSLMVEVGQGPEMSTSGSAAPLAQTGMLWLVITAVAMLVLAGFNSRKRHRQPPLPGLDGSGTIKAGRETLHTHSEGSRWHED